MLAYAYINLLSMLSRFTPDKAVRVATDIIYARTSALKRLEGVEAFILMNKNATAIPVCSGEVPSRGRPSPKE